MLVAGMNLSSVSDDEDDTEHDDQPVLSAAAAARSTLSPPSLQTLLEGTPDLTAVPHTSSSVGDSEERSKC